MNSIFRREFRLITRRRLVGGSLIAHALLMTAFVLAWNGGPARAMQFAVLAFLLPWLAARLTPQHAPPRVAARARALITALGIVVASPLPVMLMADRMAGASLLHTLGDELQVQLLSGAVVVITLAWRRLAANRLTAWMGATAVTAVLVAARLFSELNG
jgi:hypothetical protein